MDKQNKIAKWFSNDRKKEIEGIIVKENKLTYYIKMPDDNIIKRKKRQCIVNSSST
jgi:ATP-dependent DNA ligase